MGTSGPKQHTVQQQMIRRFANDNGELFVLYKHKLSIGTKTKRPKGILWHKNYYKDIIGDFDAEVLKPVEQKFATYYSKIADEPWSEKLTSGDEGAAFIDWVAANIWRTNFAAKMTKVLSSNAEPVIKLLQSIDPNFIINLIRSQGFAEYQDFLSRPQFKWKCRIFPTHSSQNLVITDNPVCVALDLGQGGRVLIVPLSKKRILFGGVAKVVEKCCNLSVREINFSMAAWAEHFIYAADRQTLEDIITDLRGEGIITDPSELLAAARKPLFGLPERAATNPVPDNLNTNKSWKSFKNSFGPSILNLDN